MAAAHTHALSQIPRTVPSVSKSTSQIALNSKIQQYCMTTFEPYVHPIWSQQQQKYISNSNSKEKYDMGQ